MRKYLIFLLFVLHIAAFSQEKFAWISDTHIGYDGADSELDEVVGLINSIDEIEFVVATGDIADIGAFKRGYDAIIT